MKILPLDGLIVLEFSQYLSGPSAGLRLADLGARVIKIERPQGGDAGSKLSIKNLTPSTATKKALPPTCATLPTWRWCNNSYKKPM
jgi:crotonobetainyl-CoA:carnitine CoA-transferase CaiB-like acyl-CoA transferase